MLALGIDPGTAICGYGLVELNGTHLKAVHYGAITTPAKTPAEERLLTIHEELGRLIELYKPDIMGVEQLFFNRNVTTAISVGQARGVILLSAAEHKLPIREFTPLQVKQSVVGYGKATKEQVIYMTTRLLGLPKPPHPDDVADALAVAICTTHAADSRMWGGKL